MEGMLKDYFGFALSPVENKGIVGFEASLGSPKTPVDIVTGGRLKAGLSSFLVAVVSAGFEVKFPKKDPVPAPNNEPLTSYLGIYGFFSTYFFYG